MKQIKMNMYFKVRCVLYYSCLLTIIVFIFVLNNSEELEQFEIETITNMKYAISESHTLANQRMVTKSMADLGEMDKINRYFLFLNYVPNCGGEFLILLLQQLAGFNNYRHVRLKRGEQILSTYEQSNLISSIYNKMRDDAIPLSFDRSIYFINFTNYDKQSPTYVNIIRDPIEKLSSRSYFGKESELLKCIQMRTQCTIGDDIYDFNIPYFCGQDPRCRAGNSEWALQMAKNTVEKFYPVVGILEDLNNTLIALENRISYFFRGVRRVYEKKLSVGLPRINLQMDLNTRNILKRILKTEYEFYEWVKSRLMSQTKDVENFY